MEEEEHDFLEQMEVEGKQITWKLGHAGRLYGLNKARPKGHNPLLFGGL